MIWAVVDTNVLVSGFGWGGPPSRIVDSALRGEFLIITSEILLDELERVLSYPKLATVFSDPAALVHLVREVCIVIQPRIAVDALADESDNRLLEAAQESGADFIVTGDRAVLDLGSFGATRVVDPLCFLEALGQLS